MPCLKECCLVLSHKTRDTAEFVCSEATIGHKRHRFQPKLGQLPITLHVDMRWFSTIRTKKDETVGANLENSGHKVLSLTTCKIPQSVYAIVCEKAGRSYPVAKRLQWVASDRKFNRVRLD
jgi:hypothetical protein